MRRSLFGGLIAVFALIMSSQTGFAQKVLDTKGWGSLTGKVTFEGKVPENRNLFKLMNEHIDKKVCLNPAADPKLKGEIEEIWVVDKKTSGVANVVIWIKAPAGTFFPTHKNFLNRKDKVIIDQPCCAFLPRVSAYNPLRYDEAGKLIATGQELIVKNSAPIGHSVQAIPSPTSTSEGFNRNLIPKSELNVTKEITRDDQKLVPQALPVMIRCPNHTWMSAQLYVFDHPYYAITKADGTYVIPNVPAGTQISIIAHHEGAGWVSHGGKNGEPIVIEAGKATVKDFKLTPPK